MSLFTGIGAWEKAMSNLGINYELVNFSEIDKWATTSYCAIHNANESNNLGDVTKVNPKEVPDFDVLFYSPPCFGAGTLVITDKGYKKIEDIKIGDMVLTHKNRYRKVLDWGFKKASTVGLFAGGTVETRVTLNHPYYTKKLNKVWNNDRRSYDSILDLTPNWTEVKDLKSAPCGHRLAVPKIKEEVNPFNLTEEDCWLLGRYVADGHIRCEINDVGKKNRYDVIYSIGNSKVEDFKSQIKTYHVYYSPHGKSVTRCIISKKSLIEFIVEHDFGCNALSKKIPKCILDLPKNLLAKFLEGFLSGDGCKNKPDKSCTIWHSITTVSRDLAISMQMLILKLYGLNCNITYSKVPKEKMIEGRKVNQNNTYQIRFTLNGKGSRSFLEDDMLWTPFKNIEDNIQEEFVYNIEVEEDNSYTANNLAVHNCQAFSLAGKQMGFDDERGVLFFDALRIIKVKKPKYALMENVKGLTGKKFKEEFYTMLKKLEEAGYNNYYKVLNSKDYGIPQNRERIFIVSIRKDIDDGSFEFPEEFDNGLRLKDMLEPIVDEKYYISGQLPTT